jgi:hypothetical protein
MNIKFVTHVGDVVHNSSDPYQWQVAKFCLSCLDRYRIQHGIASGNHDFDNAANNFDLFERTFGDEPVDGSYQGRYLNHFELVDDNILVMHLQMDIERDPGLRVWIDNVLTTYKDRMAFIVTHAGLYDCTEYLAIVGNVLSITQAHCNVAIVFSGHWFRCGGENRSPALNKCGKYTHFISQDYQGRTMGGSGMLRYYTFIPITSSSSSSFVCVHSFNPLTNQYEADDNSFFGFTLGEPRYVKPTQEICSERTGLSQAVVDSLPELKHPVYRSVWGLFSMEEPPFQNNALESHSTADTATGSPPPLVMTSCRLNYAQASVVLVNVFLYVTYALILVITGKLIT